MVCPLWTWHPLSRRPNRRRWCADWTRPPMKPPHACSIWADEDTFFVEMPSPIEGVEPTVAHIPCNAVYLWQLLRARANDFARATIATPACPTQLQLDEL